MTRDEFASAINKKYSPNTAIPVGRVVRPNCLSTTSLEMDIATGGGWRWGRTHLIYGPEDSGKTTLASRMCSEVSRYCRNCREINCSCGNFERCRTLWIDKEGTLDPVWAATNGMSSEEDLVVLPDCGEDVVDIGNAAIRDEVFDCIVLDSVDATRPIKELEESSNGPHQMGRHAKLVNDMVRKWNNTSLDIRSEGKKQPLILLINQIRSSMSMYGSPFSVPGGDAQKFYSSVIIRLKRSSINPADTPNAFVEISGVVERNKGAIAKREFTFNLALQPHNIVANGKVAASYEPGEVNNIESIIKHLRKADFIKCGGGKWSFELPDKGKVEAVGKGGLFEAIKADEEIYQTLYDLTVKSMEI